MRVLVLAPQPFYQERGTPIAVRLALEALSRKLDLSSSSAPAIDLLVYREGEDISIPGVRIIRLRTPRCLRGLRPGISVKKLLCDIFFFFHTLQLLWRARGDQYQVIHAVEESVFIAWCAKKIFGTPYIYDMDSSLALQLTEKWRWCRPLLPLLQWLEGIAVRGSIAVAPVCDALQAIAHHHGSPNTVMLRDVSLLPDDSELRGDRSCFFGDQIGPDQTIVLYVGNLESYQGIDLLIESFSIARSHGRDPHLVIVGGTPDSISHYQNKVRALACDKQISFLGPRPISILRDLLSAADIVVSPRIKGNNTPMKIYSYLHSGTALLATDLPTHRQVLDEEVAVLAPVDVHGFASGLRALLEDPQLRASLGSRARERAQNLYTIEAFERQLSSLYDSVARGIGRTLRPYAAPPGEHSQC
jgi:glycosyltransferase involved in cell wall biosynthesis